MYPDSPQTHPKRPQFFPNILYVKIYYITALEAYWKGGNCLKRPKGKFLQSYTTARFVQYGKIRVKYEYAVWHIPILYTPAWTLAPLLLPAGLAPALQSHSAIMEGSPTALYNHTPALFQLFCFWPPTLRLCAQYSVHQRSCVHSIQFIKDLVCTVFSVSKILCAQYSVYRRSCVHSIQCIKDLVCTVFSVSKILCAQHSVYQRSCVHSIQCIKDLVCTVFSVLKILCAQYSVYQRCCVHSTQCIKDLVCTAFSVSKICSRHLTDTWALLPWGNGTHTRTPLVLFRLHREMHRDPSLLPRITQQLRETGKSRNWEHLTLCYTWRTWVQVFHTELIGFELCRLGVRPPTHINTPTCIHLSICTLQALARTPTPSLKHTHNIHTDTHLCLCILQALRKATHTHTHLCLCTLQALRKATQLTLIVGQCLLPCL